MTRHPFIDHVSHREVALIIDGEDSGVEHPNCARRAEVTPGLDCFTCRQCGWSGRISGAWFMDLVMAAAVPAGLVEYLNCYFGVDSEEPWVSYEAWTEEDSVKLAFNLAAEGFATDRAAGVVPGSDT